MSQEKVLMKGNEAMAEAAIRAGCRFFFGYLFDISAFGRLPLRFCAP